jgi:hypothetical protein
MGYGTQSTSGAGGALGALAWDGAPQRGAQSQEKGGCDLTSSGGAADLITIQSPKNHETCRVKNIMSSKPLSFIAGWYASLGEDDIEVFNKN